jgi:hypothetical protein
VYVHAGGRRSQYERVLHVVCSELDSAGGPFFLGKDISLVRARLSVCLACVWSILQSVGRLCVRVRVCVCVWLALLPRQGHQPGQWFPSGLVRIPIGVVRIPIGTVHPSTPPTMSPITVPTQSGIPNQPAQTPETVTVTSAAATPNWRKTSKPWPQVDITWAPMLERATASLAYYKVSTSQY